MKKGSKVRLVGMVGSLETEPLSAELRELADQQMAGIFEAIGVQIGDEGTVETVFSTGWVTVKFPQWSRPFDIPRINLELVS